MDEIVLKFIGDKEIPLVIEPKEKGMPLSSLLDLLRTKNEFFKQKLLKYGGLLFRNFPIENEHDFVALIKNLDTGKFLDYVGGDSPRNKVTEGVYTSTEAPPSVKIPLHNELSFVKNYPKHIYFYCSIPPVEKGETIISDARQVYKAMDEKVRERFAEKGLRYVSCYPSKDHSIRKINKSHKPWSDVFETEDKEIVEKKCHENEFDFAWHKNDWLQVAQKRPSVMAHPTTGEMVWFNQAHLFDFNPKLLKLWHYIAVKMLYFKKHTQLHNVFFANEEKIPKQDLYHILETLDKETVYFPWQKGDVLVLDNILAMHGRATYTGKRRVMTAMTG